jgi:hypothetical protein
MHLMMFMDKNDYITYLVIGTTACILRFLGGM